MTFLIITEDPSAGALPPGGRLRLFFCFPFPDLPVQAGKSL